MNAEWMLQDNIVDLPPNDTTPQPAPATKHQRRRPRWEQGAIAAVAIWLAYSGIFLLISRPLGYPPAASIPPMVLLALAFIIVYLLISAIAWRCGRLV